MYKEVLFLTALLYLGVDAQAQKSFGGVNSGASSNAISPYSIGEIFVIGTNLDQNSSGTVGAFSTMILKSENGIILTKDSEIIVYPNPTEKTIEIHTKNQVLNTNVQIFDINGRLVKSKSLEKNELDLSELSNGIYLLKISETKTIKIEKQ